ncbi:WecB/TagA/CpsF family glycosyltransferase [Sphingomonas aracearum]|uniref:Glycosyltransferase n=1 Tax=Sphingomonas aracearum TaxID=2283317 RepID=A0A369VU56_9SPHN|nr:WecB/TagA/CpsF family glycosyltransferase [Sphingomonas aracearum]RDE05914.1 glycosyltransferase [Sphingomonas aracearum]
MTYFAECGDSCLIGPVRVQVARRDAALAAINDLLRPGAQGRGGRSDFIAFCNAHTVNLARTNAVFAASLRRAMVLNDGVGVDIARKILYGAPFPDNLQGTDLTSAVLARAERPLRVFLLGSGPGVAERAAFKLQQRYPRHLFVGTHHGFFAESDGLAVARSIADTEADLVLAGMGQPHQELWAERYGRHTGALVMCVGAYLDFTAGVVKRAPLWLQRARLEWAFRLAQEPRRLGSRYILGAGQFVAGLSRDLQGASPAGEPAFRSPFAEPELEPR